MGDLCYMNTTSKSYGFTRVCVLNACVSGWNEVSAPHLMHLMHIQALGLSIRFLF